MNCNDMTENAINLQKAIAEFNKEMQTIDKEITKTNDLIYQKKQEKYVFFRKNIKSLINIIGAEFLGENELNIETNIPLPVSCLGTNRGYYSMRLTKLGDIGIKGGGSWFGWLSHGELKDAMETIVRGRGPDIEHLILNWSNYSSDFEKCFIKFCNEIMQEKVRVKKQEAEELRVNLAKI